MFDLIKNILARHNLTRIGIIDIKECDIINQRILPEWSKSAIIFCIPYRSTNDSATDGFSEYARIYDYHNFCQSLYTSITAELSENLNFKFKGFCDHSPINEKLAAAKCGLGFIGRNSLFFDKEFGSFVFLGSILTDFICDSKAEDIAYCNNCGLCIASCPNNAILERGIDRNKCLSGISQKKAKTQDEIALLKEHNIVWGCDICQNVCPHNSNAKISPMPYFSDTRISRIDKEFIMSLSEEEFKKYAFSYKGRKIVLDNIDFKS
ncbi:MAG: epoxyqueuosine reductase [Ruminococcaceae bacterium]|nr:epoxyqueuosine reductase [Oscillospiraceae bacterium]